MSIHKTEGIVLRTLRHQDANLITTIYTREYGLRSFIVPGYRSAHSRKRHSYFQPLSIVEVVFQYRETRGLHKVTEPRLGPLLQEAQTHPIKLSLGLALLEVFADTVKEEEQNLPLYEFLEGVIRALDAADQRLIQLFVFFLVHHTRFLGFFPYDESEGGAAIEFDVQAGTFRRAKGEGNPVAGLIRQFAYSELALLPAPASCQQITFDQQTKRQLIRTLFDYYQVHVEGFRYPQTLRVFAEVFGS